MVLHDPTNPRCPVFFRLCGPLQHVSPVCIMQEYTFTLTQGDGSRLPGFCRRFLPPQDVPGPAGKLRYSQVICLITEAPWCAFFFKVTLSLGPCYLRRTPACFPPLALPSVPA
jgi:hypothetical protein